MSVDYSQMKIAGLKLELKKHHLQISGNKATLLKRLNDFLKPPPEERKEERKEEREEKSNHTQSQKQVINIYTNGQIVDDKSDAKNIFISGALPSKPYLPTAASSSSSSSSSSGLKNPVVSKFPPVQTVKPVFYKQPEEKKQEIMTGIIAPRSSAIGDDDEEDDMPKKPLPKKLVLGKKFTDKLNKAIGSQNTNTNLAKSVPLPDGVELPIPNLAPFVPPPFLPPPPDFDAPKKNPSNVASDLLAMAGKAHNDYFKAKETLNKNQEKVLK